MSQVIGWLGKRPTFFFQSTMLSKWDWPKDKEISTIPAPMSILSGPEHPVHPARSFLRQIFPPYDKRIVQSFMTRFKGQGLLSGFGERRKERNKPKKIDRPGIPMKIIG